MTKISLAAVSAALAIGMVAPASAATTDPEVLVYRFPGVRDDGSGVNSGVATVFHCTNFSGVDETVRFVTRFSSGGLASNAAVTIHHLATRSVSTHLVAAYDNEFSLDTTAVGPALTDPGQGTTAIAATSVNIICTAVTIDAANVKPAFAVPLRGIRFNAAPGSQE